MTTILFLIIILLVPAIVLSLLWLCGTEKCPTCGRVLDPTATECEFCKPKSP